MSAAAVEAPVDEAELPRASRWQKLATNNVLWIALILLGMVLFFSVSNPNFVKPFNIRSLFANNAGLIVLAIGMTFVIITAGIDLSVGSVLICSGVVAMKTMTALVGAHGVEGAPGAGWGVIVVGALAAIGTGLGWGVVNGFLVAFARVPPLIVTLGTLGMAIGASYLITHGRDLGGEPAKLTSVIGFGGAGGQVPYLAIIALGIAVILGLVLAYTRFGRYTYAIGSNAEATRRVGINVEWHLIKVYGLMGALAGIAGIMNLAHYNSTTLAGHTADNLNAIAAVVIGGTSLFGGRGTMAGTIIGVLIPVVLASGLIILSVNTYWQNVAVGVVLVAAVFLDQLRRRTRERR